MNEEYKGCALLQKGYTEDYLTKKRVKNDGAVPQYYVEESHPSLRGGDYSLREAALVSRYEATKAKRDAVADQISQRMVRRRKLERFIETVKALPELYTKFDPAQWSALVDSLTVMDKKRMVWTLTSGMGVES